MFYSIRICHKWKIIHGGFTVLVCVLLEFFSILSKKLIKKKEVKNCKLVKNKYLKNLIFILNNQFKVQSLDCVYR